MSAELVPLPDLAGAIRSPSATSFWARGSLPRRP